MKLFKSLLLGSAAGLVAVSGASAADLGVRKPTAAVEYVRVCSAHGAGFFYIPGSDVCMQISGRVRAEYMIGNTWGRADDMSSLRAHGRINLDTRQTTQYGLLRTYIRFESYPSTGRYASFAGASAETFGINKAFIQFYTGTAGFFTAGRSVSFFDFYANDSNWGRLPGSDRDNSNLFAYTFTFGGGLTATIAVEDAYNRRVSYNAGGLGPLVYGGQRIPDIVGNVRIDQAWGSAQLSAALHQSYALNNVGLAGANKWGWAIQGGIKVNLPMIAAGDHLWLQAAYAQGAVDYAGVVRYAADAAPFGGIARAGGVVAGADAFVIGGAVKQATSWSVVGAFVHNFTPTIQGAIYGGYGQVNNPAAALAPDFNAWAVGGRVNWIPVRNFTIGAEVMYNVLDPKGTGLPVAGIVPKGKYDSVTARIRFQRDF